MQRRILIVEDEMSLVTTLKDRLTKEQYDVTVARNGERALELATSETFDLLILDLMLPGRNGLSVCEELRRAGLMTPVLMLTARRQLADKLAGLKAGADDYLVKPFEMAELLARIEAVLRRAIAARGVSYLFENIQVDFRRTKVLRDGSPVLLSAMEFQLLVTLWSKERIVSRAELLREVWGYGTAVESRTVDVHVAGLRQKLERDAKNPQFILTIPGIGYKFAG